MNYLIEISGRYYFNRRVPTALKPLDPRGLVRMALNTDSKQIATKLAMQHNAKIERYWKDLIANESRYAEDHYQAMVERAKLCGFEYLFSKSVADLDIRAILERINHVENNKYAKPHVEAVLGALPAPTVTISNALERFWQYSKPKLINKSEDQIRKWRNPRKKAIKNFILCFGDKSITEITRDDTLKFRDWWIDKIQKEKLVGASANKDIIHVKTIMESVSDNLKLSIDINYLFKKLVLSEDDSQIRQPFETDYITSKLLNEENLSGLNDEAKHVLMAIAETGAGISEQVGLLPEDIILDHDIPHIVIVPRNKKMLKTKYRKRTIPLVGFALEAFRKYPNGFAQYRNKPDNLSAVLSKFLSEHKLFPSELHTVYSLRHSFQDRLLAVNAPDRVQADLMGHKFNRQAYGKGASLEQKLEWMRKIQLKL